MQSYEVSCAAVELPVECEYSSGVSFWLQVRRPLVEISTHLVWLVKQRPIFSQKRI